MLEKFYTYLKVRKNYSDHTLISYKTDLNQFDHYLIENFELSINKDHLLVRPAFIRSWIAGLSETSISSKSISRKLSSIRSFYKWLIKNNYCESNPATAVSTPKVKKRLPNFVSENNMDRLFDEIVFENNYEGNRDKLILELFYFTGIRRSELINLKIVDVDTGKSEIKVSGKGNKQRIIPLHPRLNKSFINYIFLLNDQFKLNSDLVFLTNKGKKMYPKAVYNLVHKYLSMVTGLKKRSPHVLRHTFATHMLNNGAELNAIKDLLGHSSLAATQVYTHNTIKKMKDSYKKAHPKS